MGGHNNPRKLNLTQINCNTQYNHRKAKSKNKQLLSLFICVCSSLCTTVAHNIAQNRPDQFSVYLREGGINQVSSFCKRQTKGNSLSTEKLY